MWRWARPWRAAGLAGIACVWAACGSSTPTSPERHGIPQVFIRCATASNTLMACRAPVGCSLYGCVSGTPSDVTASATWSVDNPSVATIVGLGLVQSASVGHTVLRVSWTISTNYTSTYFIPIGVFPGTAPLETYEYEGLIFDGAGPARTPLNGASVEILNGLPAGRSTISGSMPELFPGATAQATPGHYAFFGIPNDTYRLRVSKPGYVPQEVETRQFMDVTLVPAR